MQVQQAGNEGPGAGLPGLPGLGSDELDKLLRWCSNCQRSWYEPDLQPRAEAAQARQVTKMVPQALCMRIEILSQIPQALYDPLPLSPGIHGANCITSSAAAVESAGQSMLHLRKEDCCGVSPMLGLCPAEHQQGSDSLVL